MHFLRNPTRRWYSGMKRSAGGLNMTIGNETRHVLLQVSAPTTVMSARMALDRMTDISLGLVIGPHMVIQFLPIGNTTAVAAQNIHRSLARCSRPFSLTQKDIELDSHLPELLHPLRPQSVPNRRQVNASRSSILFISDPIPTHRRRTPDRAHTVVQGSDMVAIGT